MTARAGIHSSPYNFLPEVTADDDLPASITFEDVTLREGEQAAEIAFGLDDRVEIARRLDAVGVHQIQVGYAGDEDAAVKAIKQAGVQARLAQLLVGFKPDWRRRLESARDAGVDVIQVLYRSADGQLSHMGISREQARDRVVEIITAARELGLPLIQFSPSFVTRADWDFLEILYRAATAAGAHQMSVADSMGVARPAAIRYLVGRGRALTGLPVQIHCHNDFGVGLANTLAGIEAGASSADVAIMGLGERTGGAPLDELAMALEGLYGVSTGIKLEALYDLSKFMERLTGVVIPPMKPVVGANCFAQKLDIHVMLTAERPDLLEPYEPKLVGNHRALRLGRGSGPLAVKAKLRELGLSLEEAKLDTVVARINAESITQRSFITDDAFRAFVREA